MSKAADTGKSVHLSASAGSGKTRALKDRYLALLDVLDNRGLNIDQSVAITFTDKAAAEIKERVMRDLPGGHAEEDHPRQAGPPHLDHPLLLHEPAEALPAGGRPAAGLRRTRRPGPGV